MLDVDENATCPEPDPAKVPRFELAADGDEERGTGRDSRSQGPAWDPCRRAAGDDARTSYASVENERDREPDTHLQARRLPHDRGRERAWRDPPGHAQLQLPVRHPPAPGRSWDHHRRGGCEDGEADAPGSPSSAGTRRRRSDAAHEITVARARAARNDRWAARKPRAGGGNRTLIISLEGWSSTIELHPRVGRVAALGSPWQQAFRAVPSVPHRRLVRMGLPEICEPDGVTSRRPSDVVRT